MKTGEVLLFKKQHAFAGSCQKCRCRAPTRSAANYYRIVRRLIHTLIKAQTGVGASPQEKITRSLHCSASSELLLHGFGHGIDILQDLFGRGGVGYFQSEVLVERYYELQRIYRI